MKYTNSCTDLSSSVCDTLFTPLQDIKVIILHTKPLHKLLKCIQINQNSGSNNWACISIDTEFV